MSRRRFPSRSAEPSLIRLPFSVSFLTLEFLIVFLSIFALVTALFLSCLVPMLSLEDDVLDVISIIRLTYDRVVESHGLPSKDSE